jgi:hypothetical protein
VPTGAFPNLNGNWVVVNGTCALIPGFSTSFAQTQCNGEVLVFPSSQTQGANTGRVSMDGSLTEGLLPGTDTVCSGTVTGTTAALTCDINGVPACNMGLEKM